MIIYHKRRFSIIKLGKIFEACLIGTQGFICLKQLWLLLSNLDWMVQTTSIQHNWVFF